MGAGVGGGAQEKISPFPQNHNRYSDESSTSNQIQTVRHRNRTPPNYFAAHPACIDDGATQNSAP